MTPTKPESLYFWGTGRRKSAVARVRIRRGKGEIAINGREINDYFPTERSRAAVYSPLKETKLLNRYDVLVNVRGGGVTSQAGAILMGLSRALLKAEKEAEAPLRKEGYLTRDSRMAERKKYGRRGARRSFQFSKR
ncbi:MAG: 30S ribosomal protein S9 [Planctomycetota bacterium]